MTNISEIVNKKNGDYMTDRLIKHAIGCLERAKRQHDLSDGEISMVIDLLKEQEAVEPYVVNNNYEQHWKCGYCDSVVGVQDKYCRQCGRPVKWGITI